MRHRSVFHLCLTESFPFVFFAIVLCPGFSIYVSFLIFRFIYLSYLQATTTRHLGEELRPLINSPVVQLRHFLVPDLRLTVSMAQRTRVADQWETEVIPTLTTVLGCNPVHVTGLTPHRGRVDTATVKPQLFTVIPEGRLQTPADAVCDTSPTAKGFNK